MNPIVFGNAFASMASAIADLQSYLQEQSQAAGSGVALKMQAYSGSDNKVASLWILQTEEALSAKNAKDDKKASMGASRLSGGALSWHFGEKADLLEQSGESGQPGEHAKRSIFKMSIKELFLPTMSSQSFAE